MSRSDEMTKLGQGIVNEYDHRRAGDAARRATVQKMQNDTITLLAQFDAEHAAMTKAMQADFAALNTKLKKDHAEFKAATKKMMNELATVSAQSRTAWRRTAEQIERRRSGAKAPAPMSTPTPTPAPKSSPKEKSS
ncbi:MAG: hypothetical protein HY741_07800 [Chloroflexi bacterium]|nr:hypothetical protein [Chloroflexota bacterium]